MPPTIRKSNGFWLPTALLGLSLVASAFGQGQDSRPPDQLTIQDPAQLVGKKIKVNRLPLCEPGTYNADLNHAGMEATVVSAKPSKFPVLSKSVLDKLSPDMRDMMLDQQKSALLLLQFGDGASRDTCAAFGPKKLAEYIELAPGQTLVPVEPVPGPATGAVPNPSTNLVGQISDEEVKSALSGNGKDHWVRVDDMGLMAAQGARAPSVTLFMPDAILAIQSESARKQYIKFEPTQEDRERALVVFGEGFVAENVQGGCTSITRIILLSDPSGKVVKEAYHSSPQNEAWQNAFGATNNCQSLTAKFTFEDVQQVRAAAENREFYIAVFSGSERTKIYKIKRKHQDRLGLK
jgi:hypothetical protein